MILSKEVGAEQNNKKQGKGVQGVNSALGFIEKNLMIQNKTGALVPFIFNPAQLRLYQEIERQQKAGRPVRIIILKARQVGFSTAVAALFYQRSACHPHTNSMIVAHKADASANIFSKTKLFYETSPAAARPLKKASNAHELIFENPTNKVEEKERNPGLRSRIRIETAGAKDAGRSATIHNLHLSELAFWPHANTTMLSLMQAVPHSPQTMVIIESTACGVGGEFYRQWQRAQRGESEFVPLFFPWWEHQEYRLEPAQGQPEEVWEQEELALAEEYSLDMQQLRWRRWCISANCGGDSDLFAQEYPASAEEAFLVSGRPVFNGKALAYAYQQAEQPLQRGRLVLANQRVEQDWQKWQIKLAEDKRGQLAIYEQPQRQGDYWIGIDVASGLVRGDYSAMAVIERKSLLPVAFWHGRNDPDLLGEEAVKLAVFYNQAMLVPEINNQGIAVVSSIRRLHYPRIYRARQINRTEELLSSEFGFRTGSQSKSLIINTLARYIREDALRLRDKETIAECISYIWDEKGSTNARAGCHDDRVMALAIALFTAGERGSGSAAFIEEDWQELYGANSNTGY